MSLFTFSQEYAKASAGDAGLYHVTGIALRMIWKWVHYTHLLVMVSWMFVLGILLWRTDVVPRGLAALLPLGSLLQFSVLPCHSSFRIRVLSSCWWVAARNHLPRSGCMVDRKERESVLNGKRGSTGVH